MLYWRIVSRYEDGTAIVYNYDNQLEALGRFIKVWADDPVKVEIYQITQASEHPMPAVQVMDKPSV